MKIYKNLTKYGIVVFAMAGALAGYAMSFRAFQDFDWTQPALLLVGLYILCSGSFAINQAQEWRLDCLMDRTKNRPIPSGKVQPWQAWSLGVLFVLLGTGILASVDIFTAYLGFATVIMYNVLYTVFFKRRIAFGAVPGAIPGAMPVVIGFSVNDPNIFTPACLYLFLVMFLWQMPHFWTLAVRYRKDYAKGGFAVLPVEIGGEKTIYHIGLYTFVYVGIALCSPWFTTANVFYLLLVMPFAIKILLEFFKYTKSKSEKGWLPFFLWTNLSMLIFLSVPVFDKWLYRSLNN